MEKQRRHPLAKEAFFEGNRQRWAGIFTLIGLLVMVATSYGWIKDPAPFLQFFLSIGVTFILGASATAVMNSWKVNSQATTLDESETRREELAESITTTERIERPRDYDSDEIS
jgi:hypothetical protein